eukprot:5374799-Ditylum_brightwellii.AAC.1
MEEIEEGEYVYEMIVDHMFENGILMFKVKYYNEINGKDKGAKEKLTANEGGSPGHEGLPKWNKKEIIKECKEQKRGITP